MAYWVLFGGLIGLIIGYYISKYSVQQYMIKKQLFTTRSERHSLSFKQLGTRSKVLSVGLTSGVTIGGLVLGLCVGLVWQVVAVIVHLVEVFG